MLSKFLDPKNDVAFKRIFGTEKNKDILIHFLNDMITFKERGPIKEGDFSENCSGSGNGCKKNECR